MAIFGNQRTMFSIERSIPGGPRGPAGPRKPLGPRSPSFPPPLPPLDLPRPKMSIDDNVAEETDDDDDVIIVVRRRE